MPSSNDERRTNRSAAMSEALDKLLSTAARNHDLVAAVVADRAGLLVGTGRDRAHADRIAGIASLVTSLRSELTQYEVLARMDYAYLRDSDRRGLALWPFTFGEEEMILALVLDGPPPDEAEIDHLKQGVNRILAG